MLNVAIIGANGFIGSHLVKTLEQIPDLNLYLFGKSRKICENEGHSIEYIDLLDVNKLRLQFASIDVIYYLASATIPSSSWENPMLEFEKNLIPFITFTDCIAKIGVKKIIFISSAGTIYGPSLSKLSENADKQPFSPYGITKLTIEHFLNYFKVKYKLNFDIFRVSNVYGEGQNTSKGLGIINTFIENILEKSEIHIYGNGEIIRNYIYVKDVAKVLSFSMLNNLSNSNVYNLSSNDTVSINQLVSVISSEISKPFTIIYDNKRQSDNIFIDLDNTKLIKEMPDFKFTSLKVGVRNTIKYIKKKKI